MAKEINPQDTTRAMAFEFWMKAPNPMVTFFKTMDVSNLVKISKNKNFKFSHFLICLFSALSLKLYMRLKKSQRR